MSDLHRPVHPVRLVTASSLFDGHDASINIMRRIFQSQGAEVIHLGHNRSVQEVVDAALEEDVQGVAVSSYQGGHVEYFEYLVELAARARRRHVKVVGGGGGVIVPEEIDPAARQRGRPSSPRRTASAWACRDDQHGGRGLRLRPLGRPGRRGRRLAGDRFAIARAITGAAGARHHRHRRLGQVVADRRADPPLPPRPAGQAADRGDRGRPVAAQERRRAARRPHPDERDRRRTGLLPLAGHARLRQRDPSACRRDRRVQGRRLRPGDRRDPGIGQGDAAIVPLSTCRCT
jgi:methylmalonyl-CoA mutase cobalamin-binding domain/chain